jgi:hypothetical protein
LVAWRGWVPRVTVSFWVCEPRRIVTCTLSPGLWVAIAPTRSFVPLIGVLSMAVTTSPARRPASAAGPPPVTLWTSAPVVDELIVEVLTPM